MNGGQLDSSEAEDKFKMLWDIVQWMNTMGSLLIKLIKRKWTKEEHKMFIFALNDTMDIIIDNQNILVGQQKQNNENIQQNCQNEDLDNKND